MFYANYNHIYRLPKQESSTVSVSAFPGFIIYDNVCEFVQLECSIHFRGSKYFSLFIWNIIVTLCSVFNVFKWETLTFFKISIRKSYSRIRFACSRMKSVCISYRPITFCCVPLLSCLRRMAVQFTALFLLCFSTTTFNDLVEFKRLQN